MDNKLLKILNNSKNFAPSKNWKNSLKSELLETYGKNYQKKTPLNFFKSYYIKMPVIALVIVLLLFIPTASFAQKSSPGETLYPLKRFLENTRVFLVKNPQKRQELKRELGQRRIEEFEKVITNENTNAQKIAVAETIAIVRYLSDQNTTESKELLEKIDSRLERLENNTQNVVKQKLIKRLRDEIKKEEPLLKSIDVISPPPSPAIVSPMSTVPVAIPVEELPTSNAEVKAEIEPQNTPTQTSSPTPHKIESIQQDSLRNTTFRATSPEEKEAYPEKTSE